MATEKVIENLIVTRKGKTHPVIILWNLVLTNGANIEKGMNLANFIIVNTAASMELVSTSLVNMVEEYNAAEDSANTSSERMAEKADLADMVVYTDYDQVFLAESI